MAAALCSYKRGKDLDKDPVFQERKANPIVVAMLPLAYSLGIPGPVLLGVLPSVYGYFFIPNYPSDIATVTFDRSGTTRIGKYLLNHSFMMPGLVSVITSTIVATLITKLIY